MSAVMKSEGRSIAELIASQKPGYSLDQRFYTDPAIYDLEVEKIINRNWILAGHVSQLPESGDFKVLNVGQESAIIVRGNDGNLKAFANVCRHRGSLVCLEQHGHADKFQCPYHGWMYDIDGNLTAARDMHASFDKAAHGLKSVSIGEIHGLMLVCFDDNPPSLEGAVRDLEEPMGMFDFENLKVAAQKSYDIPANWKLAIENYQECYHCATAHPEYALMHTMMLDREKRKRASGHMHEKMAACGIEDIDIDHVDTEARPGKSCTTIGWLTCAAISLYSPIISSSVGLSIRGGAIITPAAPPANAAWLSAITVFVSAWLTPTTTADCIAATFHHRLDHRVPFVHTSLAASPSTPRIVKPYAPASS